MANQVPISPLDRPKLRMKKVGCHCRLPYTKKKKSEIPRRRCRKDVLDQSVTHVSVMLACAEGPHASAPGCVPSARGSRRVKRAAGAKISPGAPINMKVTRQP